LIEKDMKEQIKNFVQKAVGESVALNNEDNFFELGFVNSLFAMQLVSFVESEFKIQVENEDLDLNNFNSVDNLAAFVSKKQNA
jgi:methoxymalonate biosynthesis acyl carrier protein